MSSPVIVNWLIRQLPLNARRLLIYLCAFCAMAEALLPLLSELAQSESFPWLAHESQYFGEIKTRSTETQHYRVYVSCRGNSWEIILKAWCRRIFSVWAGLFIQENTKLCIIHSSGDKQKFNRRALARTRCSLCLSLLTSCVEEKLLLWSELIPSTVTGGLGLSVSDMAVPMLLAIPLHCDWFCIKNGIFF